MKRKRIRKRIRKKKKTLYQLSEVGLMIFGVQTNSLTTIFSHFHFESISAERKETKEDKDANYTRREFNYNSFKRSFTLPENVDKDNIKANYADGVLNLQLKKVKSKKSPSKKIEVA